MERFALFGPIHLQTTSREAQITQTVFAQLPGSHAHSNIGIYYTALLKECWHQHTEAKTWSLCNTLSSNTSYPSPHHANMGGTLEKWSLSKSHSCGVACVCLCAYCLWRAWSEIPYKGSQQMHQACQLQQTAAFWSDKSESPTQAPSMPPCMPPSRACSQTFLSATEPWPSGLTNREGK